MVPLIGMLSVKQTCTVHEKWHMWQHKSKVQVFGGGTTSQAEASRLAIAKGLVEFTGSKKLKQDYLDYDRHLLVADVRRREARKPNDSRARAARQKSYR